MSGDTGAYTKSAGTARGEGSVYAVAGSSGAIGGGSLNHPAMFISLNQLGSMVLDIDGTRLDARFLRETGAIDDSFTIIKASKIAPAVSLTAPADGASFTAPAMIALAATAIDTDGSAAQVEFFNGITLLGTDTVPPYDFSWVSVPAGNYSITARATDDKGLSTTSAVVTVDVTNSDLDGDGYGNHCDGDLNNSGLTNAQDYILFREQLGQPSVNPTYNQADLNCNGAVNSQDYVLFRGLLGLPPG